MRVHAAVWKFAETKGNDHARRFVQKRQDYDGDNRLEIDSKWLRGHGGRRLRKSWLNLPPHIRELKMVETPDSTFPAVSNGILDERCVKGKGCRNANTSTKEEAQSTHASKTQNQRSLFLPAEVYSSIDNTSLAEKNLTDTIFKEKIARMLKARANYHKISKMESQLKMQAAYDNGSLAGVIDALVSTVIHAIHFAHASKQSSTPESAVAAICETLTMALGAAQVIAQFDPDPDAEQLDENYSHAIIAKAHGEYKSCVEAVHVICRGQGIVLDPDQSIVSAEHKFFGKANGIPKL